ncbi:MAG: farnesyl diphosphate synthase [Thermodesulfobacteriota bacterium]|nr:farnesyl diphosphate synthase [Thermodesulfobacteriota bacterium]
MDFESYLEEKQRIVNGALESFLPERNLFPTTIHQAMRYSVFAGGKRLRPILALSSAEVVYGNIDRVLPFACALEMIHTYSLIHDDLPAMDNDDYRRGILTNHKVYGEAVAILAGDALLTEAFRLMSDRYLNKKIDPNIQLSVICLIASAIGPAGMIGGQVVDIESQGNTEASCLVNYIHEHKTAALIQASVLVGAMICEADESVLESFAAYGRNIGLAFQIVDDILDVEGDKKRMGKGTQKDKERGKLTYPQVYGLEESKAKAQELVGEALQAIESFDEKADPMREMAKFITRRRW